MATYEELQNLTADQSLIAKVSMAVAIAANNIRLEDAETPNHQSRMYWARTALFNADCEARKILWLLLAQNKDLSVSQIMNASDAAIQTATDNALLLMIG